MIPGGRVVVVDLEATCWRMAADSGVAEAALAANQANETEVIEIGAVRLDADLAEVGAFQSVVRPRRHPRLSAFCTALTGWTQADVDAAPWFDEAYKAFVDWAGGDGSELMLVSWGAWDGRQLRREAARWQLSEPLFSGVNLKRAYAKGGGSWCGLAKAVNRCGLSFVGRPHCGLDDARNAAAVLRWLQDTPPELNGPPPPRR